MQTPEEGRRGKRVWSEWTLCKGYSAMYYFPSSPPLPRDKEEKGVGRRCFCKRILGDYVESKNGSPSNIIENTPGTTCECEFLGARGCQRECVRGERRAGMCVGSHKALCLAGLFWGIFLISCTMALTFVSPLPLISSPFFLSPLQTCHLLARSVPSSSAYKFRTCYI